ncbi:MAG: D-alanyl-D-alanine carboxypeptidase family protein [Planctomycetales bacterium]
MPMILEPRGGGSVTARGGSGAARWWRAAALLCLVLGGRTGDGQEPPDIVPAKAESAASAKADLPPLQPRDTLTGPPFVSCRNWAVADTRSGKILGESGAAAVVDVASTTKIMTAHVILQLAKKEPDLLDQVVTFSERAARTSGSSCELKPGEKLPVRDMLYALLVPSGNDAAIALAEHCGRRFEPAGSKGGDDPLSRFVAEMNRTAKRLQMSHTRYLNPNGLPEKGHASSARDLVRLTVAAAQEPLFREVVATRRHQAEIAGLEGKRRTVSWKNTNRLLAISGYTGVKTGYTKNAGSCLVSTGTRGKEGLVVVVLGAPSSAAAVADSRNLYRWGWKEKGLRD